MSLFSRKLELVLFDLDGTLVDTAPDMVAVLQAVQRDNGREPVAYELGRNNVSNGAVGLLQIGFPDREIVYGDALHLEYLERYSQQVCVESEIFPGLDALLDRLDDAGRRWGIVTNKPERMTHPLLEALGLAERSACIVCGDTLDERKPHPAPMQLACEQAGIGADAAVYVGDALRDIEAGRAAGMLTVAAAYGYLTDDDDPAAWGADAIAADIPELTQILAKAVKLDS